MQALKDAGFVVDRQDGSHAILYHPGTDATTCVPMHGGRDIPIGTLAKIIRDSGLSRGESLALLD